MFPIALDEASTGSSRETGKRSGSHSMTYWPSNHDAYVVAGLKSFGIVKVANYIAQPYLESEQLMQVLADWTAEQFPILVMYSKGRHLSAKVRIVVDWVSELILQDPIFQIR
jgi:LysR family transcriptional regulator, regulator for bpeEF and oprC